jgi:hypothetical protein
MRTFVFDNRFDSLSVPKNWKKQYGHRANRMTRTSIEGILYRIQRQLALLANQLEAISSRNILTLPDTSATSPHTSLAYPDTLQTYRNTSRTSPET